jgi:ribosome-associated toxin RatA of RatAB toxin-antitoxin module
MVDYKFEVSAPALVFWSMLQDIEKYPEFITGLKKVTISIREGGRMVVCHEAEMMKPVSYTLEYWADQEQRKFYWRFIDCSTIKVPFIKEFKFMERDEGWWEVSETAPDRCSVVYHIDISFSPMIPSSITDTLSGPALKKMMDNFKKRAESLAAGKT